MEPEREEFVTSSNEVQVYETCSESVASVSVDSKAYTSMIIRLHLFFCFSCVVFFKLGECQTDKKNSTGVKDRFAFIQFFQPPAVIKCVSPAGQGNCVQLAQCPHLVELVRPTNPGYVFQSLQQYTGSCYTYGTICCPEIPAFPWGEQPLEVSSGLDFREPATERPIHTTESLGSVVFTTEKQSRPTPSKPSPIPPKKANKPNVITNSNKRPMQTIHRNRRLLPENCGIDLSQRIIGGSTMELSEHPWMVLLRLRLSNGINAFVCGGSLISSRYVLTAAHCVKGGSIPFDAVIDKVRLGEYNTEKVIDCTPNKDECSTTPQDIDVEERIVFPEYEANEPGSFNDIALLRLKKDAVINKYVKPICLPLDDLIYKIYDGKALTVAGWGRTANRDGSKSDVKLKVEVPVVSSEECAPKYRLRGVRLRETQLCAGGDLGKDSCQGDSGGPLMTSEVIGSEVKWVVTGIVSTGPLDCGEEDTPAIYTRVAKFIPWILDQMHD